MMFYKEMFFTAIKVVYINEGPGKKTSKQVQTIFKTVNFKEHKKIYLGGSIK